LRLICDVCLLAGGLRSPVPQRSNVMTTWLSHRLRVRACGGGLRMAPAKAGQFPGDPGSISLAQVAALPEVAEFFGQAFDRPNGSGRVLDRQGACQVGPDDGRRDPVLLLTQLPLHLHKSRLYPRSHRKCYCWVEYKRVKQHLRRSGGVEYNPCGKCRRPACALQPGVISPRRLMHIVGRCQRDVQQKEGPW
jgi:hypothetical protein